ncbi:MAG TPA: hypothetical protein VES21_11195, partial [Nocardioidaceae bacterium]|nr:hypothetical protein [Nocardioidaceae bacterium]
MGTANVYAVCGFEQGADLLALENNAMSGNVRVLHSSTAGAGGGGLLVGGGEGVDAAPDEVEPAESSSLEDESSVGGAAVSPPLQPASIHTSISPVSNAARADQREGGAGTADIGPTVGERPSRPG